MSDLIIKLHDAIENKPPVGQEHYGIRIKRLIGGLKEERERLRAENEELKESLTASYMLGSENGKDSAKAEIAGLKQERDRLRSNSERVASILEVVAALTDSDNERKDLQVALNILGEARDVC